jgi:phosphatidylglycerophosphate synthase
MSNTNYIVANYLNTFRFPGNTIADMTRYMERHPAFPSLMSISECFDEWRIPNIPGRIEKQELKSLDTPFMAYLDAYSSFVLVLNQDTAQVTYLTWEGEILKESNEDFYGKWDGVVFIAEPDELSGTRVNPEAEVSEKISIAAIRKVAFNQEEPPTYKFFRLFSVYFSFVFARLNVSPSVITFLWLISLLGASVLIATGSYSHMTWAIGLILLHFVLDCSDGEVARINRQTSRIGSIFEQMVHWTTNLTLIAGASLGLYAQTKNDFALMIGVFCMMADACFHYVYIQFNYWMEESVNYGWFHSITKFIYIFMPVNISLLTVCVVINRLDIFLWGWTGIAVLLFLLLTFFFLKKEFNN